MYKLYVMTTEGGSWATNAVEFDTVEEARAWGADLFSRWMLVTDYAVIEGTGTEPIATDLESCGRKVLFQYTRPAVEEVKP
jgi:hypothetical protein